nr:LysR family transcriptional regulator [uncultured Blautia sp.]
MEIRNILTFLKVAGTQNFSKAAEQLGYSQSAVTVQIQQLERELQTQLFERIGKRVYLTEQGEAFVYHANEIMKVVNQAADFSGEKSAVKGKLRIGGVESVCTALLPELIFQLYQRYPEIEVVIKSGTTTELVEMAKRNDLDFVFTLDRKICSPEWICAFEKKEEIIFVTDARENTEERAIQEIVKRPFILTEMGAAYQYELEGLLSERELLIEPILEIGNTETIIKLLKKRMGVSFLPEFTVHKELETGKLARLYTDLPGVTMHSQLLYHKNKWLTPQMKSFIKLVRETVSSI